MSEVIPPVQTGYLNEPVALAREIVKQSNEKTVVFSGAGLSVGSGIPDYRTKDNAFWKKFDPAKYGSRAGWLKDPKGFKEAYAHLRDEAMKLEPNAAHHAIHNCKEVYAHITQNVDGLSHPDRFIGLYGDTPHHLYELHGSIHRQVFCEEKQDFRPDVCLFGEQPDAEVFERASDAIDEATVLIIVGTGGEVFPAGALVDQFCLGNAHGEYDIIIVNESPTNWDGLASVVIREPCELVLPRILQ